MVFYEFVGGVLGFSPVLSTTSFSSPKAEPEEKIGPFPPCQCARLDTIRSTRRILRTVRQTVCGLRQTVVATSRRDILYIYIQYIYIYTPPRVQALQTLT